MSRAYKDAVVDDINDLSAAADLTTAAGVTSVETMSGADLAQFLHAARNGAAPTYVGGSKVLGTNAAHGAKNNAALSGADQERFAGTQ